MYIRIDFTDNFQMWQSRIEIEYYSALYVLRKWRLKFMYDYPVVLLTLALFLVVVLVLC